MTGKSSRPRSWWVPWLFVAMFAVVFGVNATMVFFAIDSWTGLDTRDHYRRGLAYNKALEAENRERQRGWQASIQYQAAGSRKGWIEVKMADRAGAPLNALTVTLRIVRPTDAQFDFDARLKPVGGGRYTSLVAFPRNGQWRIEVEAARGTAVHRARKRIEVR